MSTGPKYEVNKELESDLALLCLIFISRLIENSFEIIYFLHTETEYVHELGFISHHYTLNISKSCYEI